MIETDIKKRMMKEEERGNRDKITHSHPREDHYHGFDLSSHSKRDPISISYEVPESRIFIKIISSLGDPNKIFEERINKVLEWLQDEKKAKIIDIKKLQADNYGSAVIIIYSKNKINDNNI